MPNASALFGIAYPPGERKNTMFAICGDVAPLTSFFLLINAQSDF